MNIDLVSLFHDISPVVDHLVPKLSMYKCCIPQP